MLQVIYDAIDPIAFSIGPFEVRWYGIAYLLGFAFAILIIWRLSKKWEIDLSTDDLLTILICIMIGVIVGARLGYIVFYGNGYYFKHPLEIFAFNEGGMSFHGGLIGVVIATTIASKITKVKIGSLADMMAIAATPGLFFGRIANFINGELWGSTTDLPWGVVFGGTSGLSPRHPSQLYEALLEGLVIFIVLVVLSRKNPPYYRGFYFGLFLILYGCFRFLIEFVRQPDSQLGYLLGNWFTMGMLLSIPVIIAGIILLILAIKQKKPQNEAKPVS